MIRAGRMRDVVRFDRLTDETLDDYGNPSDTSWTELFTTRGYIRPEHGRWQGSEKMEAGALQAKFSSRLVLRSDSLTRSVTEADTAVIDSQRWNIRWINNPDGKNQKIEMMIERGVAT